MPWRSAHAPNSSSAPGAPPLNRMKSLLFMMLILQERFALEGFLVVGFAAGAALRLRGVFEVAGAPPGVLGLTDLRLAAGLAADVFLAEAVFTGAAFSRTDSAAAGVFPALRRAARSMMVASMAPASPPFAGRLDSHTSGRSAARMFSKSPSLLTLSRANSAMFTSPAHSSRCL